MVTKKAKGQKEKLLTFSVKYSRKPLVRSSLEAAMSAVILRALRIVSRSNGAKLVLTYLEPGSSSLKTLTILETVGQDFSYIERMASLGSSP